MLRTFCNCKPSKKKDTESHQNFTGSYEKYGGTIWALRSVEYQNDYSKGKKGK